MTISIWRYSHLALAVSSFVFILLASVTGIILAFEPISEQIRPYKADNFNSITLTQTLEAVTSKYPETMTIDVDANGFVTASIITDDGDALTGYINPNNGEYLGNTIPKSSFFQFVTNLHRSLFLKSIGRIFVGVCSFLLFLIAVSGSVLIIKRQRSFKKFFSKIVNENFNQYWHVVLGRLSLIPIIIITITGVYLSLLRFDILPKDTVTHEVDDNALTEPPKQDLNTFTLFNNTKLKDVKGVEFPFSEFPEDYYVIKLKDRELLVNQFDGSIISEQSYPLVSFFSNASIVLHTGKGTIVWSIILAIACVNILFFIYSGFAMTFKRRAAKLKNKFKKQQCDYIILVGSENGNTVVFANKLYEQLLHSGKKVFITELNKYRVFKKAKHIITITATYGQGDAPTNADKFLNLIKTVKQEHAFQYSVVGFGSMSYPDYCKFAFDVNDAFANDSNAKLGLPLFTVNDKSVDAFQQWVNQWNQSIGETHEPMEFNFPKPKTSTFEVVYKTDAQQQTDSTFIITLKPKRKKSFQSGDLLAIYPNNDHLERMYSVGKIKNMVQLSVKVHPHGAGSGFLNTLQVGQTIQSRLITNTAFHLPEKAKRVILIANGTGIAPSLGMIHENLKHTEMHLYYGLRHKTSLDIYKPLLDTSVNNGKLSQYHLAYSQCENHCYVQDLLQQDANSIAQTLQNDGIIMICGSLNMYKDVIKTLDGICTSINGKPLSAYAKQIKSDCY